MESVQAVCLVLVEAVSRGLISGDSVISSLTSSCASMPHWTLSVYTIAKILRIKVASSVQKYGSFTCPYSLRLECSIHLHTVEDVYILTEVFVVCSLLQEFTSSVHICLQF